MSAKGLYVLVEGSDDERFMAHIYNTYLRERYAWVQFYQYSQRKPKSVSNFIRSIRKMNVDYLFLADIDFEPCITSKKNKLVNKYQELASQQTQIVVMEIESWYIAGVDEVGSEKLKLSPLPTHTNELTKEQFNQLRPKHFDSRIDFMKELLKNFSFEQAKLSNRSFMYFASRYNQ